MKKNLLIAAVVLPLLSVSAQWTQVGGTVKVMPNTLKYVSQDYDVTDSSTIINEGWVNVRGAFSTAGTTAGKNNPGFHNIWTSRNEYGQLIINTEAAQATGTIENQYNVPPNMYFISMAFPFEEYTAMMAATDAGITSPVFADYPVQTDNDNYMPGRYNNTVWTWNNSTGDPTEFYFRHYGDGQSGEILAPELYHGLNNASGAVVGTKSFVGVPAHVEKPVSVYPYSITTSGDVNDVGELYATYVEDVAVQEPTGWKDIVTDGDVAGEADGVEANGYGDNIALFGNPYTSNIDLTGKLAGITHLWIINDVELDGDNGSATSVSNVKVITLTGTGEYDSSNAGIQAGYATGDADLLKMRPQQTFFVKGGSSQVDFSFDEDMKTFEAKTSTFIDPSARTANQDNGFYQATLKLYNDLDQYMNTEAYVFASDVIEPNTYSRYEAYNNSFGDLGFYSLQENADGTVDQEMINSKVLINGVNASEYIAKPINLVFKGNGEFTVKGELTQNLIDSNNTFYFEDRQTGEIFEVTPDFEYTFTSNGTVDDRFFMYWNGTPDLLAVDDVALASQTRVYNDNNIFKVRFADTWNSADVLVYNVVGQLVHSAKQVDANNDYIIPLKGGASAFIVKTIGDNGEVATQKIVKK